MSFSIAVDAQYTLRRVSYGIKDEASRTDWRVLVRVLVQSVLKTIREQLSEKPTNIYLLWDIGGSHYRLSFYSEYKGDREKADQEDPLEAAFLKARDYLMKNSHLIGMGSIGIPGIEADDVSFFLSSVKPRGASFSDDKDWLLNMNSGWTVVRPMAKEVWSTVELSEWMKCSEDKATEVYKRFKAFNGGDDNIPKIIGGQRTIRMSNQLVNNEDMSLSEKKIYDDNIEQFNMNMKLVDTSLVTASEPYRSLMSAAVSYIDNLVKKPTVFTFNQFNTPLGSAHLYGQKDQLLSLPIGDVNGL